MKAAKNGRSITGKPVPPAEVLERAKGKDERALEERFGKPDDGSASTHPETKRTGAKGASNVGEDESSGSE